MVKILAAVKRFKVVKFALKVWKFTLLFVFQCLTTFFHFKFKSLKIDLKMKNLFNLKISNKENFSNLCI